MNAEPDDVLRAKNGDRDALNRLLLAHGERLNAIARNEIGPGLRHRVNTSDLLQSTYLDVVRGISQLHGNDEEAFVHWVSRVLRNNAREKARFFAAKKRAERYEKEQERVDGTTASARALVVEDLLLVHRALENLEPDHRRIIELKVIQGLDHTAIAEQMGRSETAARSLLARARAALLFEIDRLGN